MTIDVRTPASSLRPSLRAVYLAASVCWTPMVATGLACLGASLGEMPALQCLKLDICSAVQCRPLDVVMERFLQNAAASLLSNSSSTLR